MINSYAYDVEVLPNFFSVTIIDIKDYLNIFNDACTISIKKGKEVRTPIPLVQKYSVEEIKDRLNKVKSYEFWISDTDDSQLLTMLGFFSNLRPHRDNKNIAIRSDLFGYNSTRYDKLMIAAFLMYANTTNTTSELIVKLYETSVHIINMQNNPDLARHDYQLNQLQQYHLPYTNVDVMTIFALNKCGNGVDKDGNIVYFPKSLKQTSINLQWYELLEHELPPISDLDINLYQRIKRFKGMSCNQVNSLVSKWDRLIIPEWIPAMMHYNKNDVFIVCEMIRLYIDEIRLRYNISTSYGVDVLSSSRSNIADTLFTKFYSDFSGLSPQAWRGKKTERTKLSFNRVILPFIQFKTKPLQDMLEEMKKVVITSINKKAFSYNIVVGKLSYTIATGGLHSKDTPRELVSRIIPLNEDKPLPLRGSNIVELGWDEIEDDSYIYVHWDISSFYPSIMVEYAIAPEHLNQGVFVKLVRWLRDTRIQAKHSDEDFIDGIPKDILAQVLKIVINSIYGKLG